MLIDTYQTQMGPRNGARVVARSWVDPQFRDWLLRDASQAIASKAWGQRHGVRSQYCSFWTLSLIQSMTYSRFWA